MQALAIMYHDVVENGDFESSGFPGEGAHVYKLRREDFERHLDAIAAVTATVSTVGQLDGRAVLLTFDDGGVSFHHPIADPLAAHAAIVDGEQDGAPIELAHSAVGRGDGGDGI